MAHIQIISPVTGTVWKVERNVGDFVDEGDVILILESMKMEIPVEATEKGSIAALHVEVGSSIEEDQILCVVQS